MSLVVQYGDTVLYCIYLYSTVLYCTVQYLCTVHTGEDWRPMFGNYLIILTSENFYQNNFQLCIVNPRQP